MFFCGILFGINGNETVPGIFDGFIILGRPTNNEISARIISNKPFTVKIKYCESGSEEFSQTEIAEVSPENPANIILSGLKTNSSYDYWLLFKKQESDTWVITNSYSFNTPKNEGENFCFVVQGDSHLLNKADKEIYQIVLENMNTVNPDLFFDLGDTFLNDKDLQISSSEVDEIYQEQIPFLSEVAKNTPLFLVLGNHEGEYGYLIDGTPDNLPVYSTLARKKNFPNPEPNSFYTGNNEIEPIVGNPQNYYEFTWGDALFVVLDPYRYTVANPAVTGDGWDWTLGDKQYEWFKNTLEKSEAKYKFVFAHHAIGNMRGGAKISNLFEWGGCNKKGNYIFETMRPLWEKPIHQIMSENEVTIFFQGHDHVFAREIVDNVVYQTIPKPAEKIPDNENNYLEFTGEVLVNSGYLRVYVDLSEVRVDYYRETVAGQPDSKDVGIVHSYTVNDEGEVETHFTTNDTKAFNLYDEYTSAEKNKKNEEKNLEKKNKKTKESKELSNKSVESISITPYGSLNAKPFLSSPEDDSIAISTYFSDPVKYYYKYGTDLNKMNYKSDVKFSEGNEVVLDQLFELSSNTKYYYKLLYKDEKDYRFTSTDIYSFITQRNKDTEFNFIVEADPHFDEKSDGNIYSILLNDMLTKNADFIVDLGDVSMSEKLADSKDDIWKRNELVRSYWDEIAHSLPFYMVKGNHDGEYGFDFIGDNPIGNTAFEARGNYFPVTIPNSFYDGLNDFIYSWEWGNALFIVLDPFANVYIKPKNNLWDCTLGKDQYDWLINVLKRSTAEYKFIFIHNLIGGLDSDNRGGKEAAKYFEWGGYNLDGEYFFEEMRNDWELPIHEICKKYEVDIVFHGHDHFFAMEEYEGIIYQLVPQPSLGGTQNMTNIADIGYLEGVFYPSPGYLLIKVTQKSLQVDLIHGETCEMIYSYQIAP